MQLLRVEAAAAAAEVSQPELPHRLLQPRRRRPELLLRPILQPPRGEGRDAVVADVVGAGEKLRGLSCSCKLQLDYT